MQSHITLIKKDSKSWIAFLILGVIFIVMGYYCLLHPFAKNISITRLFGALALLTGIIKALFSNKHKPDIPYWKRHMLIGIADILIGIFLLSIHGIFKWIFPFIFSFCILSGGISVAEEATDVKLLHTSDTDWMFLGGVLTLVSFVAVAYLPLLGSLATVLFTTIALFIIGLIYIFLSWRLKFVRKRLSRQAPDVSAEQKRNAA